MASKKIKGITIEIGADTTGLDKALRGVEKESRKAKSELADINKALKDAPESAVVWEQKQELLTKAIEESRKKVKLLEDAQEQVNEQFKAGKIGEEQYRAFERELEKARSESEKLSKQLDDTNDQIKKLGNEAEESADDIKELGDSAEESSDGFTVLKGAMADLAADGIRLAIENMKELATEGEKALNTLQSKTGATAEDMKQYGEIIDNLYNDNFGEDKNDLADSIATVKQQLGNISSEKLEEATEKALLMRDTFDFEVNESIRAANMLMKQFEISSDEAYTLIAQGAQKGLDKNGDLLDSINEYAVHYKQQGYSAEEFFNSLINGTAAGTFSVDKLGDAMKEFGIRAKDTADSTTEGFNLIGLNADEMRSKFAEGGETAKQATQETIAALFALDDKVKQNQAGVALFGTMWEDLGAQGIKALTDVSGEADKTASTLKDINDIKYNDIGNQSEQLKRKLKTELLEPIVKKYLPEIEKKADWVIDNLPKITATAEDMLPVVVGIGSAFAGWKVASIASNGAKAVKDFSAAVKSGNTIMKALNLTMNANPAVLVTTAIVGLTAAVIALNAAQEDEKTITEQVTEQYEEQHKKIQKTRDEMNKLKDDFSKRANEINAETNRTEQLWKELDKLAGASGRVKDADKTRAEYILGELNNALGTEYSMTGNQIDNYKRLSSEIDNVIAKKKAEAYLDDYLAMSSTMAQGKTEALTQYEEAYSKYKNAQSQKAEAEKAFKEATGLDITSAEGVKQGVAWGYDDIYNDYQQAIAEINENSSLMAESKQAYLEATEYLDKLDKAETAFVEKRYDDVDDILYAEKNANKEVLENTKSSLEERNKALENSITEATAHLKLALDSNSQSEIDAVFETLEECVRLANIAGVDSSDMFTEEFTKGIKEMTDKGFDISGLAKWGKESGIDIGEIYGDEYYEVVQNQLDKGYDITSLLQWGAASGYNISTLFTDEFIDKFQSTIDLGFDASGLIQWAIEQGYSMGDVFGDNFKNRVTQYLYATNDLIPRNVNSPSDAALRINGHYATGGYISSGNRGVVAESGPELLEVMNGGVRVTPLTKSSKNTALSDVGMGQKTVNIFNTIKVDKISSDYDVTKLSERLSFEERRAEMGKGE